VFFAFPGSGCSYWRWLRCRPWRLNTTTRTTPGKRNTVTRRSTPGKVNTKASIPRITPATSGTRSPSSSAAPTIGGTDEHGHDTEFTWGIDYKRRIADRWAVGVLFDYAGGGLRNSVLAPMVAFWPGLGNLQLLAAAGVEFHQGRDGGGHQKSGEGGGTDEDATYFLFRVGAGYDFHFGESFGLVPNLNLDFVNNEKVWVYGLAVTYGW